MKNRKPSYLSFRIGKENYAVSALKVLEVLKGQYITPIPNAHQYIEGVISFRGNIVPVVNIQEKLNLPETETGTANDYAVIIFDIIMDKQKTVVAAIANSANNVISAFDSEILPVPETGLVFSTEYLMGMLSNNNTFTLIVDIDKILEK